GWSRLAGFPPPPWGQRRAGRVVVVLVAEGGVRPPLGGALRLVTHAAGADGNFGAPLALTLGEAQHLADDAVTIGKAQPIDLGVKLPLGGGTVVRDQFG